MNKLIILLMFLPFALKAQYATHDSLSVDSCLKGYKTILMPTYNHKISGVYVPLKGMSVFELYNSLKANLSMINVGGTYSVEANSNNNIIVKPGCSSNVTTSANVTQLGTGIYVDPNFNN